MSSSLGQRVWLPQVTHTHTHTHTHTLTHTHTHTHIHTPEVTQVWSHICPEWGIHMCDLTHMFASAESYMSSHTMFDFHDSVNRALVQVRGATDSTGMVPWNDVPQWCTAILCRNHMPQWMPQSYAPKWYTPMIYHNDMPQWHAAMIFCNHISHRVLHRPSIKGKELLLK